MDICPLGIGIGPMKMLKLRLARLGLRFDTNPTFDAPNNKTVDGSLTALSNIMDWTRPLPSSARGNSVDLDARVQRYKPLSGLHHFIDGLGPTIDVAIMMILRQL